MKRAFSGIALLVCFALQQGYAQQASILPVDVIAAQPDLSVFQEIPLSIHPGAQAQYDNGPVPAGLSLSRMRLVLRRSGAQQKALDVLNDAQQDPGSPLYHQWLTPDEFGSRFGLAKSDLDQLTDWLKQSGFTVDEIPHGRWTIVFSGTAAQVEAAFHTQIHYFTVDGTQHRANATAFQIPQAFGAAISGLMGVHDFEPQPQVRPAPSLVLNGQHYLTPSDYAIIYDINPLYSSQINGSGQTIGITGVCNIDLSVVKTFRSIMGLPANQTSIVSTGTPPAACSGNDLIEPYLDVEWAGATAPGASVEMVVAANISDSLNYIVDTLVPSVMSTSFGSCESSLGSGNNQFLANLWQQAATSGITSMVSSGDSGAAGCDAASSAVATQGLAVNGFCTPPAAICVGGTEFFYDYSTNASQYWSASGAPLGYITEAAWNESGISGQPGAGELWASGGGYSIVYPKSQTPWQTGNSSGARGVPDVALTAAGHDAYAVCEQNPCTLSSFTAVEGTSAASPSFAGIMALVAQKYGKQGSAGKAIYALASGCGAVPCSNVFHDITISNNSVPGLNGYGTQTGWDAVTGLGSVDAFQFVSHWGGSSSPTTQPSVLLSSTSVVFPNQIVGTSATSQVVTLANNGNAALNISGLTINGTNSGDFPSTTTCPNPGSLSAGANCNITVGFKPTATGTRTAAISVADNATGSPQTLNITGNGVSTATAPTILHSLTSSANGISGGICTTPAQVTSFSTTSPAVWLYFDVNGSSTSDVWKIVFVRPDGGIYTTVTANGAYNGYACYSYFISPAAYGAFPGNWKINVYWDAQTTAAFSLNFTVSAGITSNYYFPHLAVGGGYQTVITYVNYSQQAITCSTTFFSDTGAALQLPFIDIGTVSSRTDNLLPAGDIHVSTNAPPSASATEGWAEGSCTGPVKASLLFRLFNGTTPTGEASVSASTAPGTEFVTFAQTATGLAWANPSAQSSVVTISALSSAGTKLGTTTFTLAPSQHGAGNIGSLLGISNFTGSIQVTATVPIVTLSLNFEAFPVFSSLPPGDLAAGTALAGTGSPGATSAATYYFPHLAVGGGYEAVLTYVNYSPNKVICTTGFYGNTGAILQVPFSDGTFSSRSDSLNAGASIHISTTAAFTAAAVSGWAVGNCSGPVKASLLFRLYNSAGVAQGEASVNAATASTTEFVSFAETATGIAWANPVNQATTVTVTAHSTSGATLGTTSFSLGGFQHSAANIGPLLGTGTFTGSIWITSPVPIVALSLNFEDFPVFSALPPGDLPSGTALAIVDAETVGDQPAEVHQAGRSYAESVQVQ